MSEVKVLYSGAPGLNTHVSPTNVYTAPAGKKVIIKSIGVNSVDPADQSFSIQLAGYAFAFRHAIKPNQTLILPAAGLVLQPGEVLAVGNSQGIYIRITGEIVDSNMLLLPDVIHRANGLTTSASGSRYTNSTKDILVKSVAFCNKTNGPVSVSLYMGGIGIISAKIINGYDTLTIPFLDQFLTKGENLDVWASAAGSIVYYATGIAVNT
ncbi:hypothetical protein [Paenibacillus illinoisensis]|uniref:hypothetical protein n=1 Tax=Paenibacillus illinoisensis TaxID=59845 RepID=UPI00301BFB1B